MAMVLSRPGQSLGTGDQNTLFLKVFAGEVLSAFQENNLFMDKHMVRTISSGKSAQFPVLGKAASVWHTPGESVIDDAGVGAVDGAGANYLNNIKAIEKEIFIDDILVSPVLIADIDSLKNHWDHRSEYTSAIGRSLALQADRHILAAVLATARAAHGISGTYPNDTTAEKNVQLGGTTGSNYVTAAFAAAEILDENDVPPTERYLAVSPEAYYLMAQTDGVIDSDLVEGNNGGKDTGRILKVAGFTLVKTNNMGTTDESGVAGGGSLNNIFGGSSGYHGDWATGANSSTATKALAFHRSCAGTVKMKDLSMEMDRVTERLADLIVASYAMGHGVLRPEAAVEISAA